MLFVFREFLFSILLLHEFEFEFYQLPPFPACIFFIVNTFCMTVHTCFVADGEGQKILILDSSGCALDRYLLGNLEYTTDLMAGRESHVFKYADKPNVYFNCQVRLELKDPNLNQCQVGFFLF